MRAETGAEIPITCVGFPPSFCEPSARFQVTIITLVCIGIRKRRWKLDEHIHREKSRKQHCPRVAVSIAISFQFNSRCAVRGSHINAVLTGLPRCRLPQFGGLKRSEIAARSCRFRFRSRVRFPFPAFPVAHQFGVACQAKIGPGKNWSW